MTAPVERVAIDVSRLPSLAFGRRSLSWWASMGFITIEGTTLVVMLCTYLYLRATVVNWPPQHIEPPDLLVPTINLAVLLLAVWPAHRLKVSAKHVDTRRTLRWLLVLLLVAIIATILRWFEFQSLNVKWDTNAYGSSLWGIFCAHTLLLAGSVLEVGVLAYFYATGRNTKRHFSDVEDSADYQYFLTAGWVLSYIVVVVGPRIHL
jgi:heme/copper-type cytochrome/quinol oxidase subunit 3